MIDEIRMVFLDKKLLFLAAGMFMIGILVAKGKRKLFFVPAAMITIAIANPVFFELWYKFNTRAYWRVLWIIPIVAICAIIPALIVENVKSTSIKTATMLIGTVLVVFCGSFVYGNGIFVEAANVDKLPDDVVKVAEALIKLDNEPYVVTDTSLSQYLRQYSGRIKSLYGRDVVWGVPSTSIARQVNENLHNDLSFVAQTMLNYDYDYLVTMNDEDRENVLRDAGFDKLQQINGYGVYRVTGRKTERRTYDALHRVTSITSLDEHEKPINNEFGYATIERKYDIYGNIVDERYLDEKGEKALCDRGYYELKNEYNGSKIIRKSYFDEKQNLTDVESGYAVVEFEYDVLGKLVYDRYYNKDGKVVEEGKYYLHQYLQGLIQSNCVILIAVNDDAAGSLSRLLINDLKKLGIRTDLQGKYRYSYCAVITPDGVHEDISSNTNVSCGGEIDGVTYNVSSYGSGSGVGYCSIVIDGEECSQNKRGLNFVVLENGTITDSVCFDTCSIETKVYR